MTIRPNLDAWEKTYLHAVNKHRRTGEDSPLHAWWRSPRVKAPDCYKFGTCTTWWLNRLPGEQITAAVAVQDGMWREVHPKDALISTLGKINEMSEKEVLEHTWAEIHFTPDAGWPTGELPAYRRALEGRAVA